MEYNIPYDQKDFLEFLKLGETIMGQNPLKFQRLIGRMQGIVDCLEDEEEQ
ncbi:hypothetical protein ACWJU0_18395 [Clostridioides difficile]|uniref:hypothetical protein n=1 Tax=Clostridioides difficile TaxID=1496 RepID=UPI0010275F48|nr:hypothetical protein [Clostridioides difficile]MDM0194088.1 hypothetical protein [Clostridioides difficile]MDN9274912.1 hypothetical protein [Clostridioides difficile]MDW0092764.1 hypothetical protein [Clostridioides difficile]VFD48891.1 Uncharacterised protein [Clostridioides difficile]VHP02447.1 Uncharacterised protein [Clostridioides difficile]